MMDNLRVFNTFEQKAVSSRSDRQEKARPKLSKREIVDKVNRHFSKKASKGEASVTSKGQQLGAGFMNGDYEKGKKPLLRPQEIEGSEGLERPSDIGLNDPVNPMTHEKLKTVLRSGAFSFNESEKNVLAQILNPSES